MAKICCIPNCRKILDAPGCFNLCFHKFPSEQAVNNKWCEVIKANFKNWTLKKSSYVCNLHFSLECYQNFGLGMRRMLKKGSIPTIFVSCPIVQDHNYSVTSKQVAENAVHIRNQLVAYAVATSAFISKDNPITTDNIATNNASVNENYPEKIQNDSCSLTTSTNNLLKKSFANIDLDTLEISTQHESLIRNIMKKGQNELKTLRQRIKNIRMQMYRSRKMVKNMKSLFKRVNQQKKVANKKNVRIIYRRLIQQNND